MKFCLYNITTTIKVGGIETYYWEIAKALKDKKHDVVLVAGKRKNNIKYEHIKLKQFDFTSRYKIFDLGNRFKKFGERFSFFLYTKKYLKSTYFDVFLISKPFDFFVCYFMKKWHKDIKTVFVSGGEDFYFFDTFFIKFVDYVFAVSNDNSDILKKRYNKVIKIIPNGVDIRDFYPNIESGQQLKKKFNLVNKKILISVGRIVGLKGFQLVIKSLSALDNYCYIVIGEGENLENLKKLAKIHSVDSRVLFLGAINNSDLNHYLNMADIFVQPSIGNEAFGITLIEAMAAGLPVVASRNGGMVDIVKDGNNGYLFEISNIRQMQKKILLACKNKEMLSKNAIATVKQNFTWNMCISKLIKYVK